MAITPKIIVANPSGVTSIPDTLAAFPIAEGSYNYGTTRDGVRYVIAPNGITLNEPTPVQVNSAGREKNGAIINPERIAAGFNQPFDSFPNLDDTYSTAREAAFPVQLGPGDCVIKAVSATTVTGIGRSGAMDQFGALHVVAAAPAANAFAAPFVWPVADKASRPWRVVDVDARLSELPSLSASGQSTLTWAHLSQYWDRFEIASAMTSFSGSGGYEYCTLKNFTGNDSINYDRDQNKIFNAVFMGLMLNEWSTSDKTAALIRMLQQGCQRGEAIVKNGVSMPIDGGHFRSQYASSMTWLWGTGRQDQYATWVPLVGGSVRGQIVKLDAAFLATCVPHDDITKPFPWRRRVIESVSGTSMRVDAFRGGSGGSQGDGTNPSLDGLNIIRESDGAQAYVTATTDIELVTNDAANSWMDITINAQPGSPFQVNDVVYFEPPFTLVEDTHDFILTSDRPWAYNPSATAPYRELGKDMIAHLWCHAIGMHGSLMDGALAYALRTMAANTPSGYDYAAVVDDYGPSLTGRGPGNETWQQQFYDAHAATLLALPQDV